MWVINIQEFEIFGIMFGENLLDFIEFVYLDQIRRLGNDV